MMQVQGAGSQINLPDEGTIYSIGNCLDCGSLICVHISCMISATSQSIAAMILFAARIKIQESTNLVNISNKTVAKKRCA